MSTTTAPTVTGVSPNESSLAGNMTITVTGTGFTGNGAPAVNFGSAGGSNIIVKSDTELTATNPNTGTAGPVHVTVVTGGGTSAKTDANKFTYKLPEITKITPSSGSLIGNTMVTITGKYFTGAESVNFNAAGATNVNVISDTTITVTNPNSGTAGPVDVRVFVQGQESVKTTADLFTYKLPEVTGLNPSSGSLAGGETITITGKYFTGATAVNFGEAGASNVAVLSDNQIKVTNPNTAANEVVNVRVLVQGQKSAKTTADQFTYSSALAPGVPILFTGSSLQNTFIQFIGDANLKGFYYDNKGNKKSLEANTAYSLQTIASGTPVAPNLPNDVPAVLINSFSGRVYINMGTAGLQGMSNSYTPAAGTSTDPNYNTRYQYFEPTVKNSQINVDLSYIDFTAISLSLTAFNAPHAANGKQISQSSLSMATATGAAALTPNGSVLPASSDQLPSASFARVISPQLAATSLYHDFTHYLKTTLANVVVRIAGTYVGTGNQPSGNPPTQAQSYDYTATFDDKGNVTLVCNSDSGNGSAPGVPAAQQGPGVGVTDNITIKFSDLNAATGIYGCNTPYTLGTNKPTAGITNDIYGQVVGDLLAGLNFGYVGSKTLFNGKEIGSMASTEWWGGIMPDGTAVTSEATPGGQGVYFSGVQNNPLDYNSYAGSIDTLTTGYGFPLQDRLGRNLLTMNTATDANSYLMVWVDITPVE